MGFRRRKRREPLCGWCGQRHWGRWCFPGRPLEAQPWYSSWRRELEERGEWGADGAGKSKVLRSRRPKGRVTFEELKRYREEKGSPLRGESGDGGEREEVEGEG